MDDTGLPVWPTCSLCGLHPISDTGFEHAVAAPRTSASSSTKCQFSGPFNPLPAETTTSASAIVTFPLCFSIFDTVIVDDISSIWKSSIFPCPLFSIKPNELAEILMIFISPVSSVEEKPLLVKQLLFTVNGSKLSGIPTTLDINDPSVKPARWAPKYFESADDDKINIEVFSA